MKLLKFGINFKLNYKSNEDSGIINALSSLGETVMAFTLRLNEEDKQCLHQIMEREGCKTASEAVRRCVIEYLPLTSYKDEYQRIKGLYVSLLQVLEQKNRAEQALEAEIAVRLAQLDSGAVVLMEGDTALQRLKQRSLARVG